MYTTQINLTKEKHIMQLSEILAAKKKAIEETREAVVLFKEVFNMSDADVLAELNLKDEEGIFSKTFNDGSIVSLPSKYTAQENRISTRQFMVDGLGDIPHSANITQYSQVLGRRAAKIGRLQKLDLRKEAQPPMGPFKTWNMCYIYPMDVLIQANEEINQDYKAITATNQLRKVA